MARMRIYEMPATWEVAGMIKVEAESLEDAIDRARFVEPDEEGLFIRGSAQPDEDLAYEVFRKS